MAKPIIRYKPVAMEDRVNHKTIFVPTIVDRDSMIGLDDIIIRAIDHAASGLANGIASQMYSEFCEGNGIKFGNYFYGQLHLKGTTTEDGRLTDENELHVTLYKGKGFALDRELRDEQYPFTRLYGKDVNTLVFPNLTSARSSYKMLQMLNSDVEIIGPIQMGLNKPIHFVDFGASVRDVVNIVAVAVIDAYVDKVRRNIVEDED